MLNLVLIISIVLLIVFILVSYFYRGGSFSVYEPLENIVNVSPWYDSSVTQPISVSIMPFPTEYPNYLTNSPMETVSVFGKNKINKLCLTIDQTIDEVKKNINKTVEFLTEKYPVNSTAYNGSQDARNAYEQVQTLSSQLSSTELAFRNSVSQAYVVNKDDADLFMNSLLNTSQIVNAQNSGILNILLNLTTTQPIVSNGNYTSYDGATTAATTASPTTTPFMTAAPTTASLATFAPTMAPTMAPTTAAPTTAAPTTAAPTTASPTTASPTTASPTTASPMTASPTTAAPTTAATEVASADSSTFSANSLVRSASTVNSAPTTASLKTAPTTAPTTAAPTTKPTTTTPTASLTKNPLYYDQSKIKNGESIKCDNKSTVYYKVLDTDKDNSYWKFGSATVADSWDKMWRKATKDPDCSKLNLRGSLSIKT